MKIGVIIAAAGRGTRIKSKTPKQFLPLLNKTVIAWTIGKFSQIKNIHQLVVVVPPNLKKNYQQHIPVRMRDRTRIVPGGKRRYDSVKAGLRALSTECGLVVIHDAARPLILKKDIDRCIAQAKKWGASIAAAPCSDTIKSATAHGFVSKTLDRACLWRAQTPQVFKRSIIDRAFKSRSKTECTDDAQLVERMRKKVRIVPVGPYNIKLTYRDDFVFAEHMLKKQSRQQA